jgi:LuxR family maltose regulon positive regulatory protein
MRSSESTGAPGSTGRRHANTLRSTEPPRGSDVTLRAPIAERLEQASGGVVVVHAPSGYGKTTTVAAWARRDRRPLGWIEVDQCDNDPSILLAVLVQALASVTDFDGSELSAPHGSHERYSTTIAPMLGQSVRRCRRPFALVLDDAHEVVEQPALDLIDALVHHVPPGSTVVLVGRVEPRLRLARLRVDDEVAEITASDLALDVPAARDLLLGMDVTLDDTQIGQLVTATEGWPVGLRLAGRALLEKGADSDALVLRRLDHDHVVVGYLQEEWLRGLDADELDFLMQASWLDELSARLCNTVFGRSDSDVLLDRLHTDRLLVIPLVSRGDEYRMHRLLRSVLLARSERDNDDRRRTVEQQASRWYEDAGDIDRAIRYALGANDGARAERLATQHGPRRLTTGHAGTVRRWIEMFPQTQVAESAPLCVMAAAVAITLGEADTALTWLEFARQAAESVHADRDQTRSLVRALRSVTVTRVDTDELAEAARAYDELAPGIWHALACWGYGWLSFATGDDELAARLLAEGAAEAHVAGAPTIEAQCRASSAVLCWEAGDREQATASARAARTIVRDHGWDNLPTQVLATAMSALVEAADGNPAEANADIALTRRNLVYLRAVATWSNVQCRLALARASLVLGDRVGARTFIDEAGQMVAQMTMAGRSNDQLAELRERLDRSASALPHGPSSLTSAELRVLHFLPTNLTLTEIAQRLYVSRNTAKTHAAAVYRKLGVSSRGEAVELARAVGLLAGRVAEPSSS